jgi:UDP:flavonoid glycosyltransferase YjiC (YdhE family)
MAQLGVSPRPVPKQHLSVDRLTEAIRQAIADSALRQRAAQLGTTIRAEDGVAKAVQVVHTTLAEAIATKPAVDKTLGQGSGLSP